MSLVIFAPGHGDLCRNTKRVQMGNQLGVSFADARGRLFGGFKGTLKGKQASNLGGGVR